MPDTVRTAAATGWAQARREDPAPTVAFFEDLRRRFPDEPLVMVHLARAHDYSGDPVAAVTGYERAFAAGLPAEELRQSLISYGSTLARCYLALALHSAGRSAEAVAELLALVLDRVPDTELQGGRVSLGNYAVALRDGQWTPDGWTTL